MLPKDKGSLCTEGPHDDAHIQMLSSTSAYRPKLQLIWVEEEFATVNWDTFA